MNAILPATYLILRQPGRLAEVAYAKDGVETLLFAGKRWPARRAFAACRLSIPYEGIPAFVRKESGAIVECSGEVRL